MIIDSHTHIPTPGHAGGHGFILTPRAAVEYLRAAGTDAALFNTWRGVKARNVEDLNASNQDAFDLRREFGGFLYPGASLSPEHPEASFEWLARFRGEGLLWVGELLPRHEPKCAFDDPPYMRLFEECARHGHIVQLHNGPDVKEVARRFPQMPVVCAHIPSEEECTALAALPNVWMDLSGAAGGLRVGGMEGALRLFGPDRLFYGTDFTGYEPRCFQVRLSVAVPSAEDREKILHRNITRLMAEAGSRAIV